MEFSIVHYYGKQKSRCGYCKGEKCSISDGMHAYDMLPQDYQDLIDRGWRRSGKYCYKPNNQTTCCPCYTIKCDALDFKPTKSHKKILKRFNRFLRDGKKDKSEESNSDATTTTNVEEAGAIGGDITDEPREPDGPLFEVNLSAAAEANKISDDAAAALPKTTEENDKETESAPSTKTHDATTTTTKSSNIAESIGDAAENSELKSLANSADSAKKSFDGCKSPCKKAKQMRLERRQTKLAAKGITDPEILDGKPKPVNQEKTLLDYFNEAGPNDKHRLKIVLVKPKKKIEAEAYNLYRKYQMLIHNDDPARLSPNGLQRFLYKTPLQLNAIHVKSKEFQNTLDESYALYSKYQASIHNDPPSDVAEYLDFLAKSPLKYAKPNDGPPMGYGSFHQQYWLDDTLIAVAVIDILPYCVSSVYFFYDPDYSFLSLGTYGSLREIQLVRELAESVPALKYYYMGFYIHSCPKMRYKGKLTPSHLLCPETYTWQLLTNEIRHKLDAQKYQRLNSDANARDANEFTPADLDNVKLLLGQPYTVLTYRHYIQLFNITPIDNILDIIRSRIYREITGDDDDRSDVTSYGKLVGRNCAHRMLYLKLREE